MASRLADLLTDYGMQVAGTVHRGEDVLPAMRWALADVVVMDVRMPGQLDGLEATCLLTSHYPGVAVILHTAFAGQLGEQARRVGAVAEIAKGTHPAELVNAIQRAYRTRARAHTSTVL